MAQIHGTMFGISKCWDGNVRTLTGRASPEAYEDAEAAYFTFLGSETVIFDARTGLLILADG